MPLAGSCTEPKYYDIDTDYYTLPDAYAKVISLYDSLVQPSIGLTFRFLGRTVRCLRGP